MNNPVCQSTQATAHDGSISEQLRSQSTLYSTTSGPIKTVATGYSTLHNSTLTPTPAHFHSTTIAPSPPPPQSAFTTNSTIQKPVSRSTERSLTNSSALRISTDVPASHVSTTQWPSLNVSCAPISSSRGAITIKRKTSNNNMHGVSRTPSLKAALSQSLGGTPTGPSSLVPSPVIAAMGDMTPLPSPLMCGDSPGPWKKLLGGTPPRPRERLNSVGEDSVLDYSISGDGSNGTQAPNFVAMQRKLYASHEPSEKSQTLIPPQQQHHRHTRNRSASEYIPEIMAAPKRQIAVAASRADDITSKNQPQMRREPNLAQSRGLTPTVTQPPTPPPSESSRDSSSDTSRPKDSRIELFEAQGRYDRKKRHWRALKSLGQGTFSQVKLATSQIVPKDGESESSDPETQPERKTLVAIKICEHGPKGGASEDRVEMSLKRELEILRDIHHPSLVDLKAWSIEPTRAILVLTYSPGGDLFDVATAHRNLLTPQLLRRVFAELVGAVRYLHSKMIVHRDIKLENVLVNLSPKELEDPTIDWTTYPNSVITLTDLGLSRRIAADEKLETRCGSDDYAAPEVIMGQTYDGRATDAWSLGVLLYALLESRLPFDPHPGMSDAHRMRSRTSHRIARVEWVWVEYAGEDGNHEGNEKKFASMGFLGAMEITEGLLKRARSRWTIDKVADTEWAVGALRMDGGVKFWEEAEGQVVA